MYLARSWPPKLPRNGYGRPIFCTRVFSSDFSTSKRTKFAERYVDQIDSTARAIIAPSLYYDLSHARELGQSLVIKSFLIALR